MIMFMTRFMTFYDQGIVVILAKVIMRRVSPAHAEAVNFVDRRVAVVALRSAQHTLAMSSTSFENLPKIYWLTFYVVNGT